MLFPKLLTFGTTIWPKYIILYNIISIDERKPKLIYLIMWYYLQLDCTLKISLYVDIVFKEVFIYRLNALRTFNALRMFRELNIK